MQLKKLEVFGFKSFADKTEFTFEPGITCFVGPNGCGKSNIVDAVKWVLGEQSAKSLRGKEMQDVIFNGAGSRKPLGYAEVSLAIKNNRGLLAVDFDEVCITRRLHRSGESEYFINKSPCRLRDIRELFFDTGLSTNAYAVIEQGKVDLLIQANSKERRLVFEEAAGITKFKVQKKQALNKLEKVKQNLARVTDIIEEVQRQLRSVRYQASKARRYQEYSQRLRQIRVGHSLYHYRELAEQKIGAEADAAKLESENADLVARLSEISDRQEALESESVDLEQTIRTTYEELNAAVGQLRSARQEITSNENRIEDFRRHRSTQTARLAAVQGRVDELEADLERLERDLGENTRHRDRVTSALNVRESAVREIAFVQANLEQEIESLREQNFSLSRRETDLQARLSGLSTNKANLENTLQRRQSDLRERQGRIETTLSTRNQVRESLAEVRAAMESLRNEIAAAEEHIQSLRGRIEQTSAEISELKAERRSKESRRQVLDDLESRSEGISSGVKIILNSADAPDAPLSGIHGMVADLMKVDLKYAAAIESALGSRAEAVVLETTDEALAGIEFLRNGKTGRAQFLPLDALKPDAPRVDLDSPLILGRASELVSHEERFNPLFDLLLGNTFVVESLQAARNVDCNGHPVRFVTLDGDILDNTGPVVGGQKEVGGLISRRSELDVLQRDIGQIDRSIEDSTLQLEDLKDEQQACAEELNTLHARRQQCLIDITSREGQLDQLDKQMASLEEDVELLETEIVVLNRDVDENQQKISETDQARSRLMDELQQLSGRLRDAQDGLEHKRTEYQAVSDGLVELKQKVVEIQGQHQGLQNQQQIHSRELESRQQELAQIQGEQAELVSQTREAEQEIVAARERIAALEARETELQTRLRQDEVERESLRVRISALRGDAEQLTAGREGFDQRLQAARLSASEARLKMENLAERIMEDYRVDLSAFDLPPEMWLDQPLLQPEEPAATPEAEGEGAEGAEGRQTGAAPDAAPRTAEAPAPADAQPEQVRAAEQTGEPQEGEPAEQIEEEIEETVPGVPIEEQIAYRDSVLEMLDNPVTDWAALSAEIEDLRGKINRLGPVNLDAIREQDELELRETFLTAQHDDLEQARKNEEDIIRRLNKTSRERFMETFEKVRAQFQEMFRRMFGGGKADIILEPDVDILEAGIDIIARPPGKEPRSITLLSGGEKCLTAVSLLFAIFKSKPSPFCLLDEADAALDESNTAMVAQVVQEFAQESQFIVITHNKITMSVGDVLYGITQEEKGVSKRIAVKLEDIDNHLEQLNQSADTYGSSVSAAG